MNWRSLPSLNALRAFSALAETGSYTRAGETLSVTHAAVMQQTRALEAYFGVRLATRSGRGVALTDEGRKLARDLAAGFHQIGDGVEALINLQQARPLHVTMSPVFAVKWLMPRLGEFQASHPDVTLLLNPSGKIVDLEREGMDVAIRYSRCEDLPQDADILLVLDLVVVGTPDLVGSAEITNPADLVHLPWLMELGTREVPDWFDRHGVKLDRPLMISQMPGNLIMDAVKRSDGITYTARQWVQNEIRSGELVELFPEEQAGAFHIHTRPRDERRAVRQFSNWLRSQSSPI
ncbi:LysR substrate-binding domain-containing protein [Leisingera sp. JC11]|uniref:LysR substrate-binding domain-containing protein n=1 Tax=Leisingera sp. JC11 TaxID=3042469 RepID=UPI003455EEF1